MPREVSLQGIIFEFSLRIPEVEETVAVVIRDRGFPCCIRFHSDREG
jgi:hypothetical protein